MDNFWIILFGMTCITFFCRYCFFSKLITFELAPKVKRLLTFTAPSVLTAMWAPIVFLGHQNTTQDFFESPFLIAGLVTIVLSLKVDNVTAVVVIGIGTFAVLKVLF